MPVDFARAMATGMSAARRAGATFNVVIERPAPAPDRLTGVASGSATTQTVQALQARPSRRQIAANDTWQRARHVVIVEAAGLTFVPKANDTLTMLGTPVRINVVEEYAPAGVVIGYMLAAGVTGARQDG